MIGQAVVASFLQRHVHHGHQPTHSTDNLDDPINKESASLTQPGNEKDVNVESIKEDMAHHLKSMRERKLVKVNMHTMFSKNTNNFRDLEMMVKMFNLAKRESASSCTTSVYIPVPYLESRKQIRKSNQHVHLQHDLAMDLEVQLIVN